MIDLCYMDWSKEIKLTGQWRIVDHHFLIWHWCTVEVEVVILRERYRDGGWQGTPDILWRPMRPQDRPVI